MVQVNMSNTLISESLISQYVCSIRSQIAKGVTNIAKAIMVGCYSYVAPHIVCEERGHDHPFAVKLLFKPEASDIIDYIGEKTRFPLPIMVSEALQMYEAILKGIEDGTIRNSSLEPIRHLENLILGKNARNN